jgi:hypothetical protein
MSFDSLEQSQASGAPWEIYLFQTQGQSFYLTSADEAITYLGQAYVPTTIRRNEMEETAEVDSGQIKVYIPAAHPLAQLFIPYLPPSPMALTIFCGHYGDSEVLTIFAGVVASSSFTDECELICRSDKYLLQRKIPKQIYQVQCNHIFGDAGCGVDLATVTYDGTVTAIDATGTILTIPAFASLPHSLQGGYLILAGVAVRAVVAQTGAAVTLMSPMVGLEVGAEISAVAGCQHDYSDCKSYDNVVNFCGFDLIPTINPFDETTSLN